MSRGDDRWKRLREGVDPDLAEDNELGEIEAEMAEVRRLRAERQGTEAAAEAQRREQRAIEKRRRTRGVRVAMTRAEGTMMDMIREIRIAARGLVRAPGFSLVAVLTLALGIGANALIFGVVDSVVLRPLPYSNADELVRVWDGSSMGLADYTLIADNVQTLSETAAWRGGIGTNLESGAEPLRISGSEVTANFMTLLGLRPRIGPGFSAGAGEPGAEPEVMLSHGLWTEAFGADPGVVGRTVQANGESWTVVGVLSATHDFPSSEDDFLVPITVDWSNLNLMWGGGGYQALGRLASGRTTADVQAELSQIHDEVISPSNPYWTPEVGMRAQSRVTDLHTSLVGNVRGRMMVLLGAVALVLLVVSANVANLLLSRGLARRQDTAVRAAMGAGRARLIRSGVAESVLLAGAGTLLGIVIALAGLSALRPLLPADLPRAASISIDGRVLLVTAAVASLIGIVTGLIATLRGVTRSPSELLRSGGRGGGAGGNRRVLSRGLVFAQIAVSVVLVASAGLLVRSLGKLNAIDPGFDVDRLSVANLNLSPARYGSAEALTTFYDALEERVAGLPGVEGVAIATAVPFGDRSEWVATFIDGVTDDPNSLPVLDRYRVRPTFFDAMGIEVVSGRGFTDLDVADGELVAVVDEAAQAEYWPEGAVGRVLRDPWRGAPPIRIVGVVESVRDDRLSDDLKPSFYLPLDQRAEGAATLVVRRGSGGTSPLGAALEVVRSMDPSLPISSPGRYERLLAGSMAEMRLTALLLTIFAVTTLVLGAIGLYGVAAYMVREQTRDFGVRMALGAAPEGIRKGVLTDGLRLAIPGAVLGMLLTIPAAGLIEGLLFGVSSSDPVTFIAVPVIMAAVAVLAVWVPARRVSRLDPAIVLRGS